MHSRLKIGRKTEILGKVYYIDAIEVDHKAHLAYEPIQISEITEEEIQKYSMFYRRIKM